MSDSEVQSSESSDEAEPHALNHQNEIFFKSKFAKGRLKSYNRTQPVEVIGFETPGDLTNKAGKKEYDYLNIIQQLKNEYSIIKRNNNNYILEINQLKAQLHTQKIQHIQTTQHLKKTADYMIQLCKYLEDLDEKLKSMESVQEKDFQKLPQSPTTLSKENDTNQTPPCINGYSTSSRELKKETLLQSLRRELFSFWVSGKTKTNTFKKNLLHIREQSDVSIESGFSSLDSKFSQ